MRVRSRRDGEGHGVGAPPRDGEVPRLGIEEEGVAADRVSAAGYGGQN